MAERGETAEPGESAPPRGAAVVLLVAMAVASVCGLVYELLAGALSSYLLGSSVTEFSLVVGIFLSAMGIGSWLSQHVRGSLVAAFVAVELLVGVVGGVIGVAGFAAFALTSAYRVVLLGLVIATGVLIGLEVPLVVRILQHRTQLRVSVANVLSADYLGALFGSLLFPFVLVPEAGLIRAGLLAGLANVGVGWITLWLLREAVGRSLRPLVAGATAATALLGGLLVFAQPLSAALEQELYQDDVILTRDSQYQKITITRWRDDIRLYLDGNLQFSSVDEYRYHESLVHPALSLVPHARRVLVLGGGDGLAAREILKWGPDEVLIVDLDPEITRLFRDRPILAGLNGRSLHDPRVRVVNMDAMGFLADGTDAWDVIIADLPDPNTLAVGKLYSRQFYRLALKRLSRQGVLVTQATSPFETREAFWCIVHTLGAVEPRAGGTLHVAPYTTHVPSFGEWGFVLASERSIDPAAMRIGVETRYVTPEVVQRMFVFGKDTAEVDSPVNDLDDQPLVRLYEEGYKRFYD